MSGGPRDEPRQIPQVRSLIRQSAPLLRSGPPVVGQLMSDDYLQASPETPSIPSTLPPNKNQKPKGRYTYLYSRETMPPRTSISATIAPVSEFEYLMNPRLPVTSILSQSSCYGRTCGGLGAPSRRLKCPPSRITDNDNGSPTFTCSGHDAASWGQ